MDFLLLTHVAIILTTILLGILVYLTNRRRVANFYFMAMSLVLVAWLICLAGAFNAANSDAAVLFIRLANALGATVPFMFNGLRLSIIHRQHHLRFILRHTRVWLLLAVAAMALCATDFFLAGVIMAPEADGMRGIPEPVYGPGILLYGAYQIVAFGFFVVEFVRALRHASGITRVELQFMLLASAAAIITALAMTVVLPIILRSSQVARLAPTAILFFVGIIAYGIATRRIMDVGYVLRALAAYGLMVVGLGALYAAVFVVSRWSLRMLGGVAPHVPHFLAAMVMAFAMAPAHGLFRHVADKLFINLPSTDVGRVVQRTSTVLQTIGTLNSMLGRFAEVLRQMVGCERVVILLRDGPVFIQAYPPREAVPDTQADPVLARTSPEPLAFAETSAMAASLQETDMPIVLDVIYRRVPSRELADAGRVLQSLDMAASVGIRAKGGLRGMILVGPRLTGGVYGLPEQRAMQTSADQLAVAIENATLYTQLEDSKLYSDTLVDNLVSGVIAVDGQGEITTFNREAERLTALSRDKAIGQELLVLPPVLGRMLEDTLSLGIGIRNREVTLVPDGRVEGVPLRVGTGIFHGRKGSVSGALLVFSDMSAVRKLEEQVRRTTHLASVGTLAGGMAHEIKNPLVTLKTFAQLLKERYDDEEFRTTFVDLVGKEVNRIDTIVNQLLRFGKPADAVLRPIELGPQIRESLHLVSGEIAKKGIVVEESNHANGVVVHGDARLLQQAFVNFFLNAIDAMETGGTLTVASDIVPQAPIDAFDDMPILHDRQVSVTIRDTGNGIAAEHIPHIFDPFFTTKATGTGLGLSVVHGIIREHKGIIDVESTPGAGTTFVVSFPMVRDRHPTDMLGDPRTETGTHAA